uniref:Putative secreted protein n=1 Tax=Anopheles darlingi TaxID=43151 RepID=A0A2M4DDL8_ANODA
MGPSQSILPKRCTLFHILVILATPSYTHTCARSLLLFLHDTPLVPSVGQHIFYSHHELLWEPLPRK